MALSRRILLHSLPAGIALGALSPPALPVLGQSRGATPEAISQGSLEDALLAIRPDSLLSRLMLRDVTTPLFPADTGKIEAREWVDKDLFGSVGGVQMQTGTDENGNFIGPGVYIMLRNPADATKRRESVKTSLSGQSNAKPITVGGFPGLTIIESNETTIAGVEQPETSAISLLQVGYLLINGVAVGPADGSTEFHSVANALGLLDHLRTVVQAKP